MVSNLSRFIAASCGSQSPFVGLWAFSAPGSLSRSLRRAIGVVLAFSSSSFSPSSRSGWLSRLGLACVSLANEVIIVKVDGAYLIKSANDLAFPANPLISVHLGHAIYDGQQGYLVPQNVKFDLLH